VDNRDEEADDDGAVGEEGEGNQRVTSDESFPKSECDDTDSSNRKERNTVRVTPVRSLSVGDGDSDENHTETGDEEEKSEEIELPEYGLSLLPESASRAVRFVVLGREDRLDLVTDRTLRSLFDVSFLLL